MQKTFPSFLRQLHLARKSFRESDILKVLSQEDFEELKNLNLLRSSGDTTHIMCESCDDPHSVPVQYRNGKLYAACISDSKPHLVKPTEVRRWELNVQGFLQGMASKFGIDESIEELEVAGLWQMGGFSKDDTHHTCYFFCGRDFSKVVDFLKTQPANFRRYIVITSKQEQAHLNLSQELLLIEVEHLVVKEFAKTRLTEEEKKAISQNLGHENTGTTFYGHIQEERQIDIVKNADSSCVDHSRRNRQSDSDEIQGAY